MAVKSSDQSNCIWKSSRRNLKGCNKQAQKPMRDKHTDQSNYEWPASRKMKGKTDERIIQTKQATQKCDHLFE